jgi:hypothetical protein
MKTDTKPTENLTECGNKSKPLLANRFLLEIDLKKDAIPLPLNSSYNNCYYEMNFKLLKCKYILDSYFGDKTSRGVQLGAFENGVFVCKYYLHCETTFDDKMIIDIRDISTKNDWT